ncbi:17.8 kDa class I heat shock protein-like [Henckelia pumila]|uniref:17.8 kDa class I heat shock protein-like n=1 Tax=Henckelia pumila TaxID=405737 RepID=UPI003C6E3350
MSLIPTLFGDRRSKICHPFPTDIWAPFNVFPSSSTLNKAHGTAAGEVSAFAGACVDWKETPEAHVFKADLPGLKKEEVKVEVEEGGILQISGERSREREEKNDKWHRVERSSGKFLRRFRLPEGAKVEEIKAAMDNGVLTVTVPKQEVKKPEVKAIDISG